MDSRRRWIVMAAAVLAWMPAAAAAHGETHAKPKPRFDYSKAQETPFGRPADPAKATRTVKVAMADTMRFEPAHIEVRRGETVRFLARNRGKLMHEMVLGTRRDLEEHAAMMRKHPEMEHDEPNMVHVAPGKSGDMGWTFTRAGEFYYGCLIPGHFEAGMIGKVVVK